MSFKACPLCGRGDDGEQKPFDIIEHVAWKDIPFYHCQHCEIIFKDPRSWLSFEEEKIRYGFHHNVIENEGYVSYFDPLFDFLKRMDFENKYQHPRILDYGCGPNPVLQQLMQNKIHNNPIVEAYDPFFFSEGLSLARDAVWKYQLITMTEVLEHCYNPTAVITDILNLLDGSGLWFVQTRLWSDVKNFSNWWYVRDPTHVIFYSEKTLSWICQKYHLTLLKTDHERSFLFQKNESPNDLQN